MGDDQAWRVLGQVEGRLKGVEDQLSKLDTIDGKVTAVLDALANHGVRIEKLESRRRDHDATHGALFNGREVKDEKESGAIRIAGNFSVKQFLMVVSALAGMGGAGTALYELGQLHKFVLTLQQNQQVIQQQQQQQQDQFDTQQVQRDEQDRRRGNGNNRSNESNGANANGAGR